MLRVRIDFKTTFSPQRRRTRINIYDKHTAVMMHDHNCIYISKGLNTKRAAGVIERWNNPINQYSTLECARHKYSFTAPALSLGVSPKINPNVAKLKFSEP